MDDALRLSRTREELAEVLDIVQGIPVEDLKELKGYKLVFGRDPSRSIDLEMRQRVMEVLCMAVVKYKHQIVLSNTDHVGMSSVDRIVLSEHLGDSWLAACQNIAPQLQMYGQRRNKNSVQTFRFVDENQKATGRLANLQLSLLKSTDEYFQHGRNQAPRGQLIERAFAAKSSHARLFQVADVFTLTLRRYSELCESELLKLRKGELAKIETRAWIPIGSYRPKSTRRPVNRPSACTRYYSDIAPSSLQALGI